MNRAEDLRQAMETLEKQRGLLGDKAVDTAIAALEKEVSELEKRTLRLDESQGERKLVTVLFADLSGFTELSEREDPEAVRNLVNSTFERLAQVVIQYGGFIEKYIGDEIMAIFGAPISYEDHAERALQAALDMMDALQSYNEERQTGLALHIGINTGLVVAGIIGSREHQQYGVTGDTVNLGARLKQASGRGAVFVGPETCRLANRSFDFKALPLMHFKGKSESVGVYQLLRRKAGPVKRWRAGISSPLVGRERELMALNALVEKLKKGQGGRLAVIGGAGVGKSRLIAEAEKRAGAGLKWIEGRALSYCRESSFLAVQEILAGLIEASPEMALAQLRARLEEELQTNEGSGTSEILPFLAHLLKLPLGSAEEERVKYLSGEVMGRKVQQAFQKYLEAKASKGPVVLVWEDLHWADPASLRLIESLLEGCEAIPLLMVLVFRPEKGESIWNLHQRAREKYSKGYQVLELEPLSRGQSKLLVQNLTRVKGLSPEVERLVFSHTEGNPFFVEELVRSLLDNGVLFLEGGLAKSVEDVQSIGLPTTLQGVIASRIDQLDRQDKLVLQTASVLGRNFQRAVLDRMLDELEAGSIVVQSLEELMHRDFIRKRTTDGPAFEEYFFKHAYTHEVAYNSLLLASRERLHMLAGAIYERRAGDSPEEQAALIAYHYERTPEKRKAAFYLQFAGDRARKQHVNDEAINFYKRALEQLELMQQAGVGWEEPIPSTAALLEKLADAYEWNGQSGEAVESCEAALKYLGDKAPLDRARLIRKIGVSKQSERDLAGALEQFQLAENILDEDRRPGNAAWWNEWIELQLDHLFLYYWQNKVPEMEAFLKSAFTDIDRNATSGQRARFYQGLLLFYLRQERYLLSDKVMGYAEQMMAASRETDDVKILSASSFLYGFALLWRNELEKSFQALEMALSTTERMGDMVNMVRCLNYLALAARRMGDIETTRKYAQRTLHEAIQLEITEYQFLATATMAWLAWKEGRLEKAARLGRESKVLEESIKFPHPLRWVRAWPMAALFYQQDDFPSCIKELESLLGPEQKRLEPELERLIRKIVRQYPSGKNDTLLPDILRAIDLGYQYKYI